MKKKRYVDNSHALILGLVNSWPEYSRAILTYAVIKQRIN